MKKIILILFSIVLINTGCEQIDFGDTNQNVNGPKVANTASLLSGAITNYSTRTGRPYRITPTLHVQYFMQLVYNDEMLYAEAPGYWQAYYVQVLSNLNEVITICSAAESASDPLVLSNGSLDNQKAVAKILKSVVYKRITDLFGNVPYSEALNAEILLPKYDAQEDIYKGMIAEVKAGRDMLKTAEAGPTGDVIYGGNVASWKKFANSFLLSLTMQLSKVYPTASGYAATEFKSALANSGGLIESLSDEAWYAFDIDGGFDNPWNWMRPADYGVTKEFADGMKGNGFTSNSTRDNRIDIIIDDPSLDGLPYGYETYTGTNSPLSSIFLGAGTDLALLTASYTYLNRAEAAAMGWTTEDASNMLRAGIEMSYAALRSHFDPSDALAIGDGGAYATARIADFTTATGGALQVIGEEKWVALFPLGYDAWSEWRRTAYPALSPAADAYNDGQIPTRYNYPATESTLNSGGYTSGVNALSPADDKNTAKVWWDK